MQILIPHQWLKKYLETDATVKQIQTSLSLCGPSIERVHGDVYDIEVTTNRVDCMSIYGIAREAAAILPRFKYSAKLLSDPFIATYPLSSKVDWLKVKVDPKLCPKFTALLISGIQVGPSPQWLVKNLESAGIRSLNNVVDVSNLLMHELGQPVHIFDYDKIHGHKMVVRESKPGEEITTLDGHTFELPGGDIVIEDGSGTLIDLCGIMGGQNSAVDDNTKNILLFVQIYEPTRIRKTSMNLAHRTSAAVLFEKGLPLEGVVPTLSHGMSLLTQLAGGTPHASALDISTPVAHSVSIALPEPLEAFVNTRMGIELSVKEIDRTLTSLGFTVITPSKVEVPWYRRLDTQIPEDLVEEVARLYGYHNLPSHLPQGPLPTGRNDREFNWITRLKSALKYWGFTETYTYSLVSKDMASPDALKLKNPLSSDWEYLRTSLIPSHMQVIRENFGRSSGLKLFEIANVYLPRSSDLPVEQLTLAVSATGTDLLHIKGVFEALFHDMGIKESPHFAYELDSSLDAISAQIDLNHILSLADTRKTYHPVSKFTPVIEDVNVFLDAGETYENLIHRLSSQSALINQIELVDKYNDKITLRLWFHDPIRQLSSEDIAPIREKILSTFSSHQN